uniref:Probable acyltransferase n=1 Tax=Candidatus Kentrum sp. LFY TaxID=2126342 RepID=A0A450V890_9GAMM|nr:MAG: homoserine O-acetyltransferase [Candidatus Kentron sp. LFY]
MKISRLWAISRVITAIAIGLATSGSAFSFDDIVKKRVFEMPSYTTVGGKTIEKLRVGWESYGVLGEARDNAILITHYYDGTSHAAGRYSPDDRRPGYWDSIIGSGKPIDTDKYFVISSDTLVNFNVNDPNVITTGPATVDPATGKPYGMDFPLVTIRDFVNVQKALVESLGISTLHAVAGPSMGSLQAIEWASAYPDMVERVMPVIGMGLANAYQIAIFDVWGAPIRLDPKWNGGDYYDSEPPMDGLQLAYKILTVNARHWEWANESYGRTWANSDKDPAAAFENRYKIEVKLDSAARGQAAKGDANHFLYLAKACQNFIAGHGTSLEKGLAAIDAPVLLIYAPDDLIFFPEQVLRTKSLIEADGTRVETVKLEGKLGHADGFVSIAKAADSIARFLAQ